MIPDQVRRYFETRRERYESFVERYPTYGFDDDDTQLGRVPLSCGDARGVRFFSR
jgi:hypothetical protein